MIQSRAFERSLLDDLYAIVAHNAKTRFPTAAYLLNSDVAWRLPGSSPKQSLRLWYDEQGIAGYSWLAVNAACNFDLRVDLDWDCEVAEDMLQWMEQGIQSMPCFEPWLIHLEDMPAWQQALEQGLPTKTADHHTVMLSAYDSDTHRISFLEENGYQRTEHFEHYMLRGFEKAIPEATLPNNLNLRHVFEDEFEERVATHRDAWFKSTYSLEAYTRLRSLEAFDPELDIVVVDDEGTFGSYCVGWCDHASGIGSFEPVGTRPAFRRLGLGQQVNYEGLRRMQRKGMGHAKIGTASFNQPAFGLYQSCGFAATDKMRTYQKRL